MNIKKATLILLLCVSLYPFCNGYAQDAGTHAQHSKHGQANAHMTSIGFDQLVERFESPERESWQKPEEVIQLLGNLKGKTVIDIGSGTGYFSFRLANAGAQVIASDVDPRFIEFIKKRKQDRKIPDQNLLVRQIPYDSPMISKQEADIVLLVDVYHHIENRPEYFKLVLSGLKPEGKLVVVDFKTIESPDGPPLFMRIDAEQVKQELTAAGFKTISINTTLLPWQYIVTAQ